MYLSRLLRTQLRSSYGLIVGESHNIPAQWSLSNASTCRERRDVTPFHQVTSRQFHTSYFLYAVDVVVPSMGDSITEGSISTILHNTGDLVEEDAPILQIETDKVRRRAYMLLPTFAPGKCPEGLCWRRHSLFKGVYVALLGLAAVSICLYCL